MVLAWFGWHFKLAIKGNREAREAGETAQLMLAEKAAGYDVAQAAIAEYQIVILELNNEKNSLQDEKTDASREIVGLHLENTILTNQVEAYKALKKMVQNLELQLEERDEHENRLRKQLGMLEKELGSRTAAATRKCGPKVYLDTIAKQSRKIKSLEEALSEKPVTSEKGNTEVTKEPLPKTIGADVMIRQPLEPQDAMKRLNATIEGLNGTLKDKEVLINHLKQKDAQYMTDHSDCDTQAKKQETLLQELRDDLAAEKGRSYELQSLIQERELALAAQKQVSKETTCRLEAEKQAALTTSTELQGFLHKKDVALTSQEKTMVGVQRLLNEKETELASMVARASEQTCNHTQFEQQVQEKDDELTRWRSSHREKVEEVQIAQGKTSEVVDELRRLQDTLRERGDTIAQLNKYASSAKDLHSEIEHWIGAPSGCDVPQLQFSLHQWMIKAKMVDDEAHAKFDRQEAECQQKIDRAETAARSHLRKFRDLEKLHTQTSKKYEELRNGQAAAIDATRREALLLYESSDPANRPLKRQLFNMQQSFKQATEELGKKTQELAVRTHERDTVDQKLIEWRTAFLDCERNLEEWKVAFGNCKHDLQKFQEAFEDYKEKLQKKTDAAAKFASEAEELKEEVRSLKMKRSQEYAKHGEIPTLSGRKRGEAEKGEDESAADAASAAHKRVKED